MKSITALMLMSMALIPTLSRADVVCLSNALETGIQKAASSDCEVVDSAIQPTDAENHFIVDIQCASDETRSYFIAMDGEGFACKALDVSEIPPKPSEE